MNQYTKREDDFEERRMHLADLSEGELEASFWHLLDEIVSPLLDLAYQHTSPSIERSVLLRMGFSSLEAQPLVDMAISHNLISHGLGHLVYVLSKEKGLGIREAGLSLLNGEGWDFLVQYFQTEDDL